MNAMLSEELNKKFADARTDLQTLQAQLDKAQSYISSDMLIPDELSDTIISTVNSCKNSKGALMQSLESYAIASDLPLSDIEKEVEKTLGTKKIRSLLIDYFRLTSEVDSVVNKLNEAKLALKEKCSLPVEDFQNELEPYRVVVDYVAGKIDDISDEQSEVIENVMSRTISRALDKDQITFGDISEGEKWIEAIVGCPEEVPNKSTNDTTAESGSITISESETTVHDNDKLQTVSEESLLDSDAALGPSVESCDQKSTETSISQSDSDAASAQPVERNDLQSIEISVSQKLWPCFNSYIQKNSVSIEDVPSNKFRSSDFNGMARKNSLHPAVLRRYFDIRLFPLDADQAEYNAALLHSRQEADYLLKHEYLAIVRFTDPDGTTHDYVTPSSMAYEALNNKTILNNYRGKERKSDFDIWLRNSRKPSVFSDLYLHRCRMLIDRFMDQESRSAESDLPDITCAYQTTDYVFKCLPREDELNCFIVPALFESGKEQETIDIIRTALEEYGSTCRIILIIESSEDIHYLVDAICMDRYEYIDCLRFAVKGEKTYYDGNGTIIDSDKQNTEDDSLISQSENNNVGDMSIESGLTTSPEEYEQKAEEDSVADLSSEKNSIEKPENIISSSEFPDSTKVNGEKKNALPTEGSPVESAPAKKTIDLDYYLKSIDKYEQFAYAGFASDRNDVGSVLLKSLCAETEGIDELKEKHSSLCAKESQYAFATGDPMLKQDYRLSHLQTVFNAPFGQDMAYDTLAVSAYLRMYFSSDAGIEAYSAASIPFSDNLAIGSNSPLNDLFYKLTEYVKHNFSGIESQVLLSVYHHGNLKANLQSLQNEAAGWFVDNRLLGSSHHNNRIIENRKLLFGSGSIIRKALQAVADNDLSKIDLVQSAMDAVSNRPTPKNIEAMMDEYWDQTAFGKDRAPLVGVERNTLRRQLIDIFDILSRWQETAQASKKIRSNGAEQLQSSLAYIKSKLESAKTELTKTAFSKESCELNSSQKILLDTINEMLSRYSNPDSESQIHYYIHLLEHPLVAVNDGFVPHIEMPEEETEPFNFCERASEYLQLERKEWPEVINRFYTKNASRIGGDFGCASVLFDYLDITGHADIWPAEYVNIDRFAEEAKNPKSRSIDAVQTWQQDFQGRLDMADGDEWFKEPDEHRNLQQIIDNQYLSYYFNNNFGFYGRAMLRVLVKLTAEAESHRSEYEHQLKEAIANNTIPENAPIYATAQKMIEKNRFGAFRSYLQMAERGETDVSASRLSDHQSYFARFCLQCNDLYSKTRLTREQQTLLSIYKKSGLHRENAIGRTAMILMQNWPESESNQTIQAGKFQNVADALGLPVEKSEPKGTGIHLTLKDPGRVINYPHPIADFGSRMYANGLQVHAVYGNLSADVLFTKIREILQKNNNHSFLILVNCALPLQERRKLAKMVSNSMWQSPMVIIDRALALYLTTIPQAERWKAVLQCTLPFLVANPYFESSAVEIPPEMFIGRTRELDLIRRSDGANLIYGGRQLGKTALLKRARVLEHHPSEGNWAVYEDIKNKNGIDAAARIAKTLTQQKFFSAVPEVNSWNELLDQIENRLMDNQDRLLLLLDEADAFLASTGQNKYNEIQEIKHLQDITGGRFKCVMAGLHNVLRLYNSMALSDNSAFAHFQGLTIKPLDFKDARALLEIPLSYLGFTIPEEHEDIITQILYNTNYFPGLVHFYASRLIQYAKSHINEMKEPPYELKTETLLSLLADQDFHDLRNDRIRMTLYIDANEHSYYDILATTMCYGYNNSDEYKLYGMSADDIRRECTELTPNCSIARLSDEQLKVLLNELVELNIFQAENGRYMFRRASFTEIFNSPQEVENHFLDILSKEAD